MGERIGPLKLVVVTMAFVAMVGEVVSGTRWIVGSNMGWSSNVNYAIWAQDKHLYKGDWLFFVYDRKEMNVLEVNKSDYESCKSENPMYNWTRGAGRDVVPLNMTRKYYFISGKGDLCSKGMKLSVEVENPVMTSVTSVAPSPWETSTDAPTPSPSSSTDVPSSTSTNANAPSPAMSSDASPLSCILGLYALLAIVAICLFLVSSN